MSKPWMWISSGTGRTFEWKLKMPCDEQPIHSARSFAFAREVDSATMRQRDSIWEEMYLILEMTTSRTGPTSPPMRCISSTMSRETFCTPLRCFHRREIMSQRCGVLMMMVLRSSNLRSVVVSPVSISMEAPSCVSDFRHAASRSSASDCSGAMKTQRPFGSCCSMRRMANSAQMVLPEPVGAPMSTLSSELKSVEKTCVWIGLKCEKALS
mmetsp:Transcript_51989/g.113209  ORF Transcript_51989/g.113209 Transcript_51989/m.113209 type:complete len:211 (+) Transcript_51989:2223-2855(+)